MHKRPDRPALEPGLAVISTLVKHTQPIHPVDTDTTRIGDITDMPSRLIQQEITVGGVSAIHDNAALPGIEGPARSRFVPLLWFHGQGRRQDRTGQPGIQKGIATLPLVFFQAGCPGRPGRRRVFHPGPEFSHVEIIEHMKARLFHATCICLHPVDGDHTVPEALPGLISFYRRQEHPHIRKIEAGLPVRRKIHFPHLAVFDDFEGARVCACSGQFPGSFVLRLKIAGIAGRHPTQPRPPVRGMDHDVDGKMQRTAGGNTIEEPAETDAASPARMHNQVYQIIFRGQCESHTLVFCGFEYGTHRDTKEVALEGTDRNTGMLVRKIRKPVKKNCIRKRNREERVYPLVIAIPHKGPGSRTTRNRPEPLGQLAVG